MPHYRLDTLCTRKLVKLQALIRGILVRKYLRTSACKIKQLHYDINEELSKESPAFRNMLEFIITTDACENNIFSEIFYMELAEAANSAQDAPLHGYTDEMQREILYLEDAIRKRIQVIQPST